VLELIFLLHANTISLEISLIFTLCCDIIIQICKDVAACVKLCKFFRLIGLKTFLKSHLLVLFYH
jgi:hypothetical protein